MSVASCIRAMSWQTYRLAKTHALYHSFAVDGDAFDDLLAEEAWSMHTCLCQKGLKMSLLTFCTLPGTEAPASHPSVLFLISCSVGQMICRCLVASLPACLSPLGAFSCAGDASVLTAPAGMINGVR